MRLTACCGVLVVAAGLAGCGSSSSTTEDTIVSNGTTTIVSNGSTRVKAPPAHTFSHPGMAIRFSYREPLAPTSAVAQQTARHGGKRIVAALGIGGVDDLLTVTLQPPLTARVTSANLPGYEGQFDSVFSQLLGRRWVSSVATYGGAPALTFPRMPTPGAQTAGTTTRVILLFSGNHEYELECAATPAHLATIEAACKEMLQTVRIT